MPVSFSITHGVEFCETDMAGIVHFSNYFRWMEEVEHAFFRSLGLSVMVQDGVTNMSWPRVAASCEYLGPACFEDVVTLNLRVARVGATSFTYEIDFIVAGKPIAKGKLTSVCCQVTPTGFTPINIPAAIRAKLADVSQSRG
jgi:YbgC/YbaW family acyl-CoA thioester hydrolase